MENNLIKTTIEDHIAVVTMDAPPVNAQSREFVEELISVFDELNETPTVRVIVLTGAVDLKLDTKIAIAVAIENGRRLVVIIVDGIIVAHIVIAVQTIWIVTAIIGVPATDQLITGRAALIVAVEAILTERKGFIACVIASPDSISAAGTEYRFVFQTACLRRCRSERRNLRTGRRLQ